LADRNRVQLSSTKEVQPSNDSPKPLRVSRKERSSSREARLAEKALLN